MKSRKPRSDKELQKEQTLKEGSEEAAAPPCGRSSGRSEFAAVDKSKRGPNTLLPPRVPPPGLKLKTVWSDCITRKSESPESNRQKLYQRNNWSIYKQCLYIDFMPAYKLYHIYIKIEDRRWIETGFIEFERESFGFSLSTGRRRGGGEGEGKLYKGRERERERV